MGVSGHPGRAATAATAASERRVRRARRDREPSPRWWAYLVFTLLGVGLVLSVCTYVIPDLPPMAWLGAWSLPLAFAFITAGIICATRLR